MKALFDFPDSTKFGGKITKNKIYQEAKSNTKTKSYFTSQVEKILWSHKLASETVNISGKQYPREIQIITLLLKTQDLNDEVLKAIDKAIPSPIIFVLRYRSQVCYAVAYKRVSEADKTKRVISSHFRSGWLPENADKIKLPATVDLLKLYQALLCEILSVPLRDDEEINTYIKRIEQIKLEELEAEKMKKKLKKERQFNRQVDLNSKIKTLERNIETLKGI